MSRLCPSRTRWFTAAAVSLACISSGRADDPPQDGSAVTDDAVARLEALAGRQQREIEALERQAAAAQDVDEQRAELMRRQIREILSEQEFRESLMPAATMAGYDGGFYIRTSDEKFNMTVNGLFQNRWTHYGTRDENRWLAYGQRRNDRTGFDLQRMRITLKGHVYEKDLTYNVTMRADAPDTYDFRIHYAFFNYRFRDELQFQGGIFRLASTRSQVQSDQNLSLIDRPMTDAVFGMGVGLGARIWGQLAKKRLEYYLDVANALGSSGNRTITPDPAEMDNNPAILFRTVWHALGDEPGKDFRLDADLPRHTSPALNFGFNYVFNDDQGDSRTLRIPFPRRGLGPGGFGLTNSNGLQIHQFGLDSGFKYCGFSALGEYIVRIQDVRRGGRTPFTPLWLLTGDGSTNVQHGAYVTAGYFLPIPGWEDKLEVVARIGGISALAGGQEGAWEYSGGLNYYIKGNNVRLSTDVTRVYEAPISSSSSSLANVNDDALVWRIQLQVSF